MAGVDKEFLRLLKEKVNIIDVAAGYLTLEKRGGSYWACCPFHHEKTPSFAINEAEQYYHCFGCSKSGDVIKFVSEMENCDFMDSVKILADVAKLELPKFEADNDRTVEIKRKRDACLKILNETAHFYLDNLNSGKAGEHTDYIVSRKILASSVRKFGLGASLNFNDLPRYLLSKGYDRQDIVDSGVVNDVDGRLSDAMGGRLIFPIINAYGEVIAFGGRALKKDVNAKYVNTRKTLIFDKKKNLYNINLFKKLKASEEIKYAIMVEGYMDTVSLYTAGFKNVVASMGTSLTQEQARLIKRYTDTVLISYDGDAAGQKANLRGLDILKGEGINVKVVPLPTGLDPDDVIKQQGNEGYQRCLDAAMPLIDYKLKILARGFNLNKTEDKRSFVAEAVKIIRTADSEAEKEDLLKGLSAQTGFSFGALKRDLENAPKVVRETKEPVEKKKDTADVIKKASRFVIASFLFRADYAEDKDIDGVDFADGVHVIIAKYIKSKKMFGEDIHLSELFDDFFKPDSPEYEELERVLDYAEGNGLKGEVGEKYFLDCVKTLKIAAIDKEIAEEQERLAGITDLKRQEQIVQKVYSLTQQKQKLKNDGKV